MSRWKADLLWGARGFSFSGWAGIITPFLRASFSRGQESEGTESKSLTHCVHREVLFLLQLPIPLELVIKQSVSVWTPSFSKWIPVLYDHNSSLLSNSANALFFAKIEFCCVSILLCTQLESQIRVCPSIFSREEWMCCKFRNPSSDPKLS